MILGLSAFKSKWREKAHSANYGVEPDFWERRVMQAHSILRNPAAPPGEAVTQHALMHSVCKRFIQLTV